MAEWVSFYAQALNLLIDVSIKGAVILIIAGAMVFSLRRASASTRHLVWNLALVALLALPFISFLVPALPVPVPLMTRIETASETEAAVPPQSQPSEIKRNRIAPRAGVEKIPAVPTPEPVDALTETASATTAPADRSSRWIAWAIGIWIAGAMMVFARLVAGALSVWRMVRRARAVTADSWNVMAGYIALQLGLRRQVRLLESERVSMPMTCGAFRSVVMLPVDAGEWPEERRAVVLSHEIAHVKRRDCLTQMLAQLACALHWFNPLVWIVARQLRVERERACDDHVLNIGTKASEYAAHLLEIARSMQSMKGTFMAAVAMAKPSQLEGRLLAILDPRLHRRNLSRVATTAVAIALASVVLPLAAMRPSAHAEKKSDQTSTEIAPGEGQKSSESDSSHKPASVSKAESKASEEGAVYESDTSESDKFQFDQNPNPDPQDQKQTEKTDIDQAVKGGVVGALKEALKDSDAGVREQALHSLGMIGGSEAIAVMIEALKDGDPNVREKAAWALGMRGGQAAIDPLISALRDQNANVREQAAWALGMKGDQRAVEPLMAALKDENPNVREQAAWALGMRGDRRAVDALVAALKDANENVREQAAWALGMRGDSRAVDGLIEALQDTNAGVREQAAWALGMKGNQRALEALKAALKDKSSEVREQAAWAIGMVLMRSGGRDSDDDKDKDKEESGQGAFAQSAKLRTQPMMAFREHRKERMVERTKVF
ncbi:MAG: HEAT repeat domain-containing protein [Acidobacteriota bacterium]